MFTVSPACFLTARALEQIKNDVAYSDNPVKLIGISAGVSYGALGSTHHSLHDFAVLQAINNIDIVAPADNFEARSAIEAAVGYPKPLYIRFGKKPMIHLHDPDTQFEIGKAITVAEGNDVAFIATGETVSQALMAAQLLAEQGISAGVVSMHSLRPLDEAAIFDSARRSSALITVEEHSVFGGLGGTVAALLMENGIGLPFKIVGIPDECTVTGSQQEIFAHYGITAAGLAGDGAAAFDEKRGCLMRTVLAIDQSTSATKALLFAETGELLDKTRRFPPANLPTTRLGRTRRGGNLPQHLTGCRHLVVTQRDCTRQPLVSQYHQSTGNNCCV